MNFGSDNWSGVHPAIMAALADANQGAATAYGTDDLTAAATAAVRDVFDAPQAIVLLLAGGTAANGLSLAALTPPWGRVFCHDQAHIHTSEAGAPEFFTNGAKLALVPGASGLMTPGDLAQAVHAAGRDDVHAGQSAAVSLTNATEAGTIYTPAHVAALAQVARAAGLRVHMDGARIANAIAALGCAPADVTWRAGVDVLSLGATKNGCMALEAVVIFDPALAEGAQFRRMRAGHLWSKHRYLAAQMLAWLNGGLWLDLARHANAMAARLGQGLAAMPAPAPVLNAPVLNAPVQTNSVFATLPCDWIARARSAGARFHDWPHQQMPANTQSVRFVCSWQTAPAEVDRLLAI